MSSLSGPNSGNTPPPINSSSLPPQPAIPAAQRADAAVNGAGDTNSGLFSGLPAQTVPTRKLKMATRLSANQDATTRKIDEVAAKQGITPPKFSSKFIVDEVTGKMWKVTFKVPGGVVLQSEAAFENIRAEFTEKRIFDQLKEEVDPNTGKVTLPKKQEYTVNFEMQADKTGHCKVNGKPILDTAGTPIAVSAPFLQTYNAGLTSIDADKDVILERQVPAPNGNDNASDNDAALEEVEQALNSPTVNEQTYTEQTAKLNKMSGLSAAQEATKNRLLQRSTNQTPLTKYERAAYEYRTPNAPISEASHIATLNGINELNGHKVNMLLPADGKAWQITDSSLPNHISTAGQLHLRPSQSSEAPAFTALPLCDGTVYSMLVIDKNGVAYLYDPSKKTPALSSTLLNALHPKVTEVITNPEKKCTNDADSSLYCANFLEWISGLIKNEKLILSKKMTGKRMPLFTDAVVKRAELAQQNSGYQAKIKALTKQQALNSNAHQPKTALDRAMNACTHNNLTKFTKPIPEITESQRVGICEDSRQAVDLALGKKNTIVIGDLDGTAAADLSLRSPLGMQLIAPSPILYQATKLPIMRNNQEKDYSLSPLKQTPEGVETLDTIDTVLSKAFNLPGKAWNDDGRLSDEAKKTLVEHVYRQADQAVEGKSDRQTIYIDLPNFYRNLSHAQKKEIRDVYEDVFNSEGIENRIEHLVLTGTSIEKELEEFTRQISATDFFMPSEAVNELDRIQEDIDQLGSITQFLDEQLSEFKARIANGAYPNYIAVISKKSEELKQLITEKIRLRDEMNGPD